MCRDAGVTVSYHNHNWEFENAGGDCMKMLIDLVPAELMKLMPDVGMIPESSGGPVKYLNDNWDRVGALHIKMIKDIPYEIGKGFTGTPEELRFFSDVTDFLYKKEKENLWVICEQGSTNLDHAVTARKNYLFTKGLLGL